MSVWDGSARSRVIDQTEKLNGIAGTKNPEGAVKRRAIVFDLRPVVFRLKPVVSTNMNKVK
jgi:hypothetical protein